MRTRILFVISEVGSANYCLSLWSSWKKNNDDFDWKILTNERVIRTLELNKFGDKIIKDYDSETSFEINLKRLQWYPEIIFSSAANKNIEFESMLYSFTKKIIGIQFLDTWYSYHGRLAKQDNKMLATSVCVIDKESLSDAIQEGIKEEKIYVIGQPALEEIRSIPKKENNNIMFVNQPISKYAHLKFLNYNEKDVWSIVFDSMKQIRTKYDSFYFAKHPDDDNVILSNDVINELDIEVIQNGQLGLSNSDTVIGMFSTIMIDAFLQKKTVLSVQPSNKKRNCCFLSRKKYVPLISNSEELINSLKKNNENFSFGKIKKNFSGSLNRLNSFLINTKNEITRKM